MERTFSLTRVPPAGFYFEIPLLHFAMAHLCQASAAGVEKMAFPVLHAMVRLTDGRQTLDPESVGLYPTREVCAGC